MGDKLKRDVVNYRQMLKDEQQKTINLEADLVRMRERMQGMAKELGELRTQNRVLMLS